MEKWYLFLNGQQVGPVAEDQILAHNPTADTMVWREGMAEWLPISSVPQLMALITPQQQYQQPGYQQPQYQQPQYQQPQQQFQQPQQQYQQPGYQQPYQQPYAQPAPKDKTVAGILALLLGSFGAHYFYCGKVGGGFICLLLSLVTCGLWGIIPFIQGILILTMTQQQFDQKWVYNPSTFPVF